MPWASEKVESLLLGKRQPWAWLPHCHWPRKTSLNQPLGQPCLSTLRMLSLITLIYCSFLFMGVLGLPLFLLSHDAENLKSLPLSSSMVVSKVWIMWYFPVGQNCEASLYSHTRIKSSFRLFIPTHFSGFSLTLRCLYFNTIEGLALGNSLLWGLHPFCPLDAPSS